MRVNASSTTRPVAERAEVAVVLVVDPAAQALLLRLRHGHAHHPDDDAVAQERRSRAARGGRRRASSRRWRGGSGCRAAPSGPAAPIGFTSTTASGCSASAGASAAAPPASVAATTIDPNEWPRMTNRPDMPSPATKSAQPAGVAVDVVLHIGERVGCAEAGQVRATKRTPPIAEPSSCATTGSSPWWSPRKPWTSTIGRRRGVVAVDPEARDSAQDRESHPIARGGDPSAAAYGEETIIADTV